MIRRTTEVEKKSAARLAFAHYLRTGERLDESEFVPKKQIIGLKYNHNHDPENGRFTFSSEGFASAGRSAGSAIRLGSARPHSAGSIAPPQDGKPSHRMSNSRTVIPAHAAQHSAAGDASRTRGTGHTMQAIEMSSAVVYRRADGKAYKDPRTGKPMLKPKDVNMANTVRFAKMFSSPFNRYMVASIAFNRGGVMDFQRTKSNLRAPDGSVRIDRRYIAFGNYNFGVYAAASGMSLSEALKGGAALYNMTIHRGRGFNNSGPHHGNPRNSTFIVSGYRDYMNGKVGH